MRKLLPIGAIIFGISIASAQAQAAGCGSAEVVKGDAQLKRAKSASAVPLKVNDKVCSGDEVSTSKDARVKLAMEDGNVLNITPSSAIKIEAYENNPDTQKKKVLLNVMYGKMRATVKQKYTGASNSGEPQTFQVKTKSAVAGVRGTDFLTSFDRISGKTAIITFEGSVEVGKLGAGGIITNSVFVNPGFTTEAGKASAPIEPKPVPVDELKKMDSGSQATITRDAGASGNTAEAAVEKKDKDQAKKEDPKPETDGKKAEPKKPADDGKKTVGNEEKDRKGPKSESGRTRSGVAVRPGAPGSAPVAGSSPADPTRAPANMFMPPTSDLSMLPPAMGELPLLPPPITFVPLMPQMPTCDFCDRAIQTGSGKLNVNVCVKGSPACP